MAWRDDAAPAEKGHALMLSSDYIGSCPAIGAFPPPTLPKCVLCATRMWPKAMRLHLGRSNGADRAACFSCSWAMLPCAGGASVPVRLCAALIGLRAFLVMGDAASWWRRNCLIGAGRAAQFPCHGRCYLVLAAHVCPYGCVRSLSAWVSTVWCCALPRVGSSGAAASQVAC